MRSGNASMTTPEAWDAALASAFDILLGEAPASYDAAGYAVYYASDSIDEFLFPNAWATPESLADPEPRELPDPDGEYPFSPWVWRFVLSESLFHFDSDLLAGTDPWSHGGHKGPRPFDDDFVADARAASLTNHGEVVVRGADLGPLLARHGIDLTHKTSRRLNCWLTVLLRVTTDGTLGDAMRAATFTHRWPEHRVAFGEEGYFHSAEERWESALSTIADPTLRDHLRMLCLDAHDARSNGAWYCGRDTWPFSTDTLEAAGCSLVAGWEFGESQAGTAVVQLAGSTLR